MLNVITIIIIFVYCPCPIMLGLDMRLFSFTHLCPVPNPLQNSASSCLVLWGSYRPSWVFLAVCVPSPPFLNCLHNIAFFSPPHITKPSESLHYSHCNNFLIQEPVKQKVSTFWHSKSVHMWQKPHKHYFLGLSGMLLFTNRQSVSFYFKIKDVTLAVNAFSTPAP